MPHRVRFAPHWRFIIVLVYKLNIQKNSSKQIVALLPILLGFVAWDWHLALRRLKVILVIQLNNSLLTLTLNLLSSLYELVTNSDDRNHA